MNEDSDYRLINTGSNEGLLLKGNTPVKKRSEKGYLKDRFSKIVSVYVPNDDAEKVLLKFNDDAEVDVQERQIRTLLQSLDDGLSYEVELLCNIKSTIGREDGRVKCACVFGDKLFISFEGDSQIFRLCISADGVLCDSIWMPKVHGLSLFSQEIRATSQFVYVSGSVISEESGVQWMIVKYDHDERVVACTKRYSYQKFGRFDIDRDGNLLLLTPNLEHDGIVSQISKLTESFETRKYYINLGDEHSMYQPLFVAAHGPKNKAWVTMIKKQLSDNCEEEHRIMCFHCCVDNSGGDKDRLRAALGSNRWGMSGFKLGVVATLGNYVLAIDQEQRNLCFISWDEVHGHPVVRKISAPGSPNLVHLCTDGVNEAFLFTEQSIFLFKFHEQLIKDSEILV